MYAGGTKVSADGAAAEEILATNALPVLEPSWPWKGGVVGDTELKTGKFGDAVLPVI